MDGIALVGLAVLLLVQGTVQLAVDEPTYPAAYTLSPFGLFGF
jgi:hypothetical protein